MQFRFGLSAFYRCTMIVLMMAVLTATPYYSIVAQSQTSASDGTIYTVQIGDTLSSIARRFGVTTQALADANNLVNVNFIYVGQQLILPESELILIPTQSSTTTLPPTPTATRSSTTTLPPTALPPTALPPMPAPTNSSTTTLPPTPAPTNSSTTTLPPTPEPTNSSTTTLPPTSLPPTAVPSTGAPETAASPWTDPDQLVEVFSPVSQTSYHSPLRIIGLSRTFESTVSMRLVDEQGFLLAERFAMGGGVDGYDFFETYMRFFVNEPTNARLEFLQTAGESDELPVQAFIELTLLPSGQRSIDLLEPAVNATFCDTIDMAGYSLTFEGLVNITLEERNGTLVTETFVTGGGVDFRAWHTSINSPAIDEPMALLLSVYETGILDGSTIDQIRVPISVYPAGHDACER